MQIPVPEKSSEEQKQSSPLKRLSRLSLELKRSSIPSPFKVKSNKIGEIYIENGYFKSIYEYQIPEGNLASVSPVNIDKASTSFLEETKTCRICLSQDNNSALINPCACNGSQKYLHEGCLKL